MLFLDFEKQHSGLQGNLKLFTAPRQMKALVIAAAERMSSHLPPLQKQHIRSKSLLTLSLCTSATYAILTCSKSVCSLTTVTAVQDGQTYCRRRPCDCEDPDEDLFCCPSCDNRPSSQCLDQSGRTLYRSGASWLYGCQQCRCMVRTQKQTHLHKVDTCVFFQQKAVLQIKPLSVV